MEQNKYDANPQASAAAAYTASLEKSRTILNKVPKDVRPPTDSLYFGKV